MRRRTLALSLMLCLPLAAQSPRIDVGNVKRLSDAAAEHVEVSLDGSAIRLALGSLKDRPDVYDLVKEIKGVYGHVFRFDADNKFSAEDVERIRQQIKSPPWERIISVKRKKDGEDADVYTLTDPKTGAVKGLVAIGVKRREVAVVNIVGNIGLEDLARLGGSFGVPRLDVAEGGER